MAIATLVGIAFSVVAFEPVIIPVVPVMGIFLITTVADRLLVKFSAILCILLFVAIVVFVRIFFIDNHFVNLIQIIVPVGRR